MTSDPKAPIDLEHLATYTLGDRALELELLTMFVPSAKGYIEAMGEGPGAGFWTAAHSLKGVALGVGATELADLAALAEPLKDAGREIRDEHIAKLGAALERVRRFVADTG